MRVCAGIVLFNPKLNKLEDNIRAIIKQVDDVILIDNASDNIVEIENFLQKFNYKVDLIKNTKNEGIAAALNQILNYALTHEYEYFLTLDQDSICNSELICKYKDVISQNIAQLTCRIVDKENDELDKTVFCDDSLKNVDYCITSGCLNRVSAILKVGKFEESLFIDGVDLDISLRLRNSGYSIKKLNYVGLVHELGEKKNNGCKYRVLKTSNHVPWRNYYARRNLIYVARKYYIGIEKYKRILIQVIFGIGAVLFEDKKLERLRYNLKGIIEGLNKKIE